MKQRIAKGLLVFVCCVLIVCVFGADYTTAYGKERIALNKNTVKLEEGKKVTIKTKNAEEADWTVSGNCVEVVKKTKTKITIRGIAEGKAIIKASYSGDSCECTVNVYAKSEPITKVGDLVYNANKIKMCYKGVTDNSYITFEIQNKNKESIKYSILGLAANGCMLTPSSHYEEVSAGKKGIKKYYLTSAKDWGITQIDYFDLAVRFTDSDYDTIDDIVIHIAVTGSSKQFVPNMTGTEIIDNEILSAYFVAESKKIDDMFILYKNNSDKRLEAGIKKTSINDVMIPSGSGYMDVSLILPGCYASSKVEDRNVIASTTNGFIKENELTVPKRIDGCLIAQDRIEWDELVNTGEITLYKKKVKR